jgi:thiamine biosynthesis protein ThiS
LPARPEGDRFDPLGMRVIVNDEPRETAAATLAALLEELGCAQEPAVAAAVDGQVVPRVRWSTHALVAGAQILVIRAAQGG